MCLEMLMGCISERQKIYKLYGFVCVDVFDFNSTYGENPVYGLRICQLTNQIHGTGWVSFALGMAVSHE